MNDCSIIIPVYCQTEESVEWLEECLDSACSQDCEVVVSDDGSTANLDRILYKFRNLVIVRGEHVGVSRARNQGVLHATRSLLIPLDCDDRLVPKAVDRLLSVYDGITPVYPDIRKFGLEDVAHYQLLDFACDHIYTHVGFSSVNVLHRKDQWKTLGGWNEHIDFYEDGEYNARLFANWCGKRFPEPLVEYRIHEHQRTKVYNTRARSYAKKILSTIRSLDMPCSSCGKGRKAFSAQKTSARSGAPAQPVASPKAVDVNVLPGEIEGRILAQYVGGTGRGKHYYRGPRTNFPYKVTYGDYLYVDATDTKEAGSSSDKSLFIRMVKVQAQAPVAMAAPEHRPVEEAVRQARKNIEARVAPATKSEIPVALPDIINMSVKEITNMDAMPPEVAKRLLRSERNGKNRSKVITFLQGVIGK